MQNIYEIAKKAGIDDKYVIPYGLDKAKIDTSINEVIKNKIMMEDKEGRHNG